MKLLKLVPDNTNIQFLKLRVPFFVLSLVLIIGIITSVFTGVTLTRMFVAGWLRKARPNDITI